jgi:hypothetical protein
LLGAIPLILIFRKHDSMLAIVVGYAVFNILVRFSIIQINILLGNYLSIGMKRFYVSGLIVELLMSLVLLLTSFSSYYMLTPVEFRLMLIVAYFLVLIYLDSRKNLFYVSKTYILHKHKFTIIQWSYKSIDKVYVYPDRIVFVKGKKKLKVGFANDENAVTNISVFLKPYLGKKLINQ